MFVLLAQVDRTWLQKNFAPAKNFPTLASILNQVIPAILALAGIIFFAMLLWGGYLYMNSEGSGEALKKAQKTFTFAILGLVLVLTSFIIVRFIGFIFRIQLPV